MKHRIRASHLKRGAFGLVVNGEPMESHGALVRFDTIGAATAEGNRRAIVFGDDCRAYPIESMPMVRIYGWNHVLASSGAN